MLTVSRLFSCSCSNEQARFQTLTAVVAWTVASPKDERATAGQQPTPSIIAVGRPVLRWPEHAPVHGLHWLAVERIRRTPEELNPGQCRALHECPQRSSVCDPHMIL